MASGERFLHPRQPALDRGNRWEWSRTVAKVKRRDHDQCQVCGARDVPIEVDHIIPRAAGGTDQLDNLRAICKPCHKQRLIDALRGTPDSGTERPGRLIVRYHHCYALGPNLLYVHGDMSRKPAWPSDGTCPPECQRWPVSIAGPFQPVKGL